MTEQPLNEHTCKSCGNNFVGLYCNLCGEKIIEPKDRKFRTFIGSVLIATTIVDNKFLRSLWLTIKNPGFLSREYVDGRRVHYMRPLEVFLILNLIYFLFPVLQMFSSTLYSQLNILPHRNLARKIISAKLSASQMSMQGFELMYNEKTMALAKLLIVLFIVLASLPLSLIFRKKNRFFTDHVALSVELTSFNLAVNTILLTVLLWTISKLLRWSHLDWGTYLNDKNLTILFVLTNIYFLFRAARTFYSQKGKRQAIKVILGIVGLFLALEAYRFMLFFITVWSL